MQDQTFFRRRVDIARQPLLMLFRPQNGTMDNANLPHATDKMDVDTTVHSHDLPARKIGKRNRRGRRQKQKQNLRAVKQSGPEKTADLTSCDPVPINPVDGKLVLKTVAINDEDDDDAAVCVALDDETDTDADDIDSSSSDSEANDEMLDEKTSPNASKTGGVYLGGKIKQPMPAAENDGNAAKKAADPIHVELEFDRSTYKMYHSCQILYPCMSFDIIDPERTAVDAFVENASISQPKFPIQSCYVVAGTQAAHANANRLLVMKMSNLTALKQTNKDSDDESSDDESDNEETDLKDTPELLACEIRQRATINRVRMSYINDTKPLVACWYDNSFVSVWDVQQQIATLNDSRAMQNYKHDDRNRAPIYTFKGHQAEGFAIDWSVVTKGFLATGDCLGTIHIWKPSSRGQWYVDEKALRAHTGSVEDVQWSPTEANVLASASCDKTLRIWDIRQGGEKACMLTCENAHDADVNVVSWNRLQTHLLASGGDDGVIKVWDLRKFGGGAADAALATFRFHTAPITSLEWCPHDASVFAASSEDDRITQWDISVERDSEAEVGGLDEVDTELAGVPPQLLFVHCGQTEIKEIHWHARYAGVLLSTAQQGLDIFKTISV